MLHRVPEFFEQLPQLAIDGGDVGNLRPQPGQGLDIDTAGVR
jgi:hypothetical protein